MAKAYQTLVEKFLQLNRLEHAMTFLQWDQLVMMPPKGNEARSNSLAELTAMSHELLISSEIGELLEKAKSEEADPLIQKSLFEMERNYRNAICLPSSLVKAQSLAGSKCEHGWRTQKGENDWAGFLQNFKEVVVLAREEAQARQAKSQNQCPTPYDAMLDLYCVGDSSEFIEGIFTDLKATLPQLVQQVLHAQKKQLPLTGGYPVKQQEQLSRELMKCLGFDFEAGRLDVSMHPFSTGDRGDNRITSRYREDEFVEGLMATAHETGHAAYENGLPEKWTGLPVGDSRNMCVHESQSLFFEKQIFLSQPFLSSFTGQIHTVLEETIRFDADDLLAGCLHVEPSYIRVEADEVTYPLHVILRFEIERDLINGAIEAEDIPELWDSKMQEYLGLSTGNDHKNGCMQDIHWTDGSFGYFPSYTLGAINAAQLFNAMKRDHDDWAKRFAAGDVRFAREWLSENIWSKGSTMESQEIIIEATGERTNGKYLLNHLKARYLKEED